MTILSPFPTYSVVPDYGVLEEVEEEDLRRLSADQKLNGPQFHINRQPQQQKDCHRSSSSKVQSGLVAHEASALGRRLRSKEPVPAYWRPQPMSPYPHDEDDDLLGGANQDGFEDNGEAFDPEEGTLASLGSETKKIKTHMIQSCCRAWREVSKTNLWIKITTMAVRSRLRVVASSTRTTESQKEAQEAKESASTATTTAVARRTSEVMTMKVGTTIQKEKRKERGKNIAGTIVFLPFE